MCTLVVPALAESLDKPFPWAVGFFFGNTELSLELWNVIAGIAGISGVDESLPAVLASSNMLECRDYLFLVAN